MHDEAEVELNSEGAALLRMLGLDDQEGFQGERLRKAITAHGVSVAPLYGTRKDHKVVDPGHEQIGPKVRPVCGAEDCATKRVSYLLCLLTTPLIGLSKTHCSSTINMLQEIENLNQSGKLNENCIVGSLDIDSLYPSLDISRCARVVSQKLYDSDLKFPGLDWREIGLYLTFHLTNDEILEEGIREYCPKRRSNRGEGPKFTASGSKIKKNERFLPWIFTEEAPTQEVTRKMFCVAIRIMIIRVMELHDFHFDGKIYRQKAGGSIGLDLTGVVSDVYMEEWDVKLIEKAVQASIKLLLYKRYKDDTNVAIDKSGILEEGAIISDRSMMLKLKALADSIDPSLKATTDVGSNHEDGRLPILDLKVWIEESISGIYTIMHSHYIKEVASKLVMLDAW